MLGAISVEAKAAQSKCWCQQLPHWTWTSDRAQPHEAYRCEIDLGCTGNEGRLLRGRTALSRFGNLEEGIGKIGKAMKGRLSLGQLASGVAGVIIATWLGNYLFVDAGASMASAILKAGIGGALGILAYELLLSFRSWWSK